jgi:hypothetical protein
VRVFFRGTFGLLVSTAFITSCGRVGVDDGPSDAAPDGDAASTAKSRLLGWIHLSQQHFTTDGPPMDANAVFYEVQLVPHTPSACDDYELSGCEIAPECTAPPPMDAGAPPMPRLQSAGDLRVVNLSAPSVEPLVLRPRTGGGAYDGYYEERHSLFSFGNGDTLEVIATGGEVTAFRHDLVVTGDAEVQSPRCTGKTCPPVHLAADYVVEWKPIAVGDVRLNLFGYTGTAPNVGIHCRFPASTGVGRIPREALSKLPLGTTRGHFSVSTHNETEFESGAWTMTFATTAWSLEGDVDISE